MSNIVNNVTTHHVLQQSLKNHALIKLLGGDQFIELDINKLNLTNKVDIAAATSTPLHTSAHPWMADVQRARLNEFMDRTFQGVSVEELIKTPDLNRTAYDQMKLAAERYVADLRDTTAKGILDARLFLTAGDPRLGGLDPRAQAEAYLSPSKFEFSVAAEQTRQADLAALRTARADLIKAGVDPKWAAFNTPAKMNAFIDASLAGESLPFNLREARQNGLARYISHIDDGSIVAHLSQTPAARALPANLLKRIGLPGLLGVVFTVALMTPEVARASTAGSVQERDNILRDAVVAAGLELGAMALGLGLLPETLVAAVGYGLYKYASDAETRQVVDDWVANTTSVVGQMSTRLVTGQMLPSGPVTTEAVAAPGSTKVPYILSAGAPGVPFSQLGPNSLESLQTYVSALDSSWGGFFITDADIFFSDAPTVTYGVKAITAGPVAIAYIVTNATTPSSFVYGPDATGYLPVGTMFTVRGSPDNEGGTSNFQAVSVNGIVAEAQLRGENLQVLGAGIVNTLRRAAMAAGAPRPEVEVRQATQNGLSITATVAVGLGPSDYVLVRVAKNGWDLDTNSGTIVEDIVRSDRDGTSINRTVSVAASGIDAVDVDPVLHRYAIRRESSGRKIYVVDGDEVTVPDAAQAAVFAEMEANAVAGLGVAQSQASDAKVTVIDATARDIAAAQRQAAQPGPAQIAVREIGPSIANQFKGDRIVSVSARLVADRLSRTYRDNDRDFVAKDEFEQTFERQVRQQVREIGTAGQIGSIFGSTLGRTLAGDSQLGAAVLGGLVGSLARSVGQAIATGFAADSIAQGFDTGLAELPGNLQDAALGALSSFITAELVHAIGLGGVVGDLSNAAVGSVIGQIAANLADGGQTMKQIFDISGAQVLNAVGSLVGNKLAAEVVSFETIGGQIGSSIGSAIGSLAMTELAKAGTLLAGPLGAVIGAFAGFIIGGLIGSIFGGTPRSGADAAWDDTTGQFVVANVWSRKGGAKDAARSIAASAAETFNAIIVATGGALSDPAAVQAGNYGMRKKAFVYRPVSTQSEGAISRSFEGKDAAQRLLSYGISQGLADADFQLVGGDVYIKRALYGSPALTATTDGTVNVQALFGDLTVARDWSFYRNNPGVIEAVSTGLSASERNAYLAGWIATTARAKELGLDRRAASDWYGGYSYLLTDAGTNAALSDFYFDYDERSDRYSRVIQLGRYKIADAIDVAGQTVIAAGVANDVIDLRNGSLTDQRGFTVNGHFNDGIAVAGEDFVGVLTQSITIQAGQARGILSVASVGNFTGEKAETFQLQLNPAANAALVGPDSTVTIVGDSELPYLSVGRSFAAEADGYAVFRVALSRPAEAAVTLELSLADRTAEVGKDFSAQLQISADGLTGWTDGSAISLAAGITQYFVRVALTADAVSESSETFELGAKATVGAIALANGANLVRGRATITDGATTLPLAWVDDAVVHAGGTAVVSVGLSRPASGTLSLAGSTADRAQLAIGVAASVDADAGDDVVHASDRGDNVFGGAGNDTLYGGRLDDWLLGGDGDDVLDAGGEAGGLAGDGNYLDGGAGNDVVRGREGSDWLEGGDGADTLTGGAGDDVLAGGGGDGDTLRGQGGDDQYLVRRGGGADTAEDEAPDSVVSVQGAGDFISRRFADLSSGAVERDWWGDFTPGLVNRKIDGGDDSISFGVGIGVGDVVLKRDPVNRGDLLILVMEIDAVTGATRFSGTQLTVKEWFTNPFKKVEWLRFADGNAIRIGDVTSFVIGGSGNDVLIGTLGNDFVYGGDGNDRLFLLAGDDIGNGSTGNDLIAGDSGKDLILGGSGADDLMGGLGNDVITGDGGDDVIYGGGDDDILSGGLGDDFVAGGEGDDVFKFTRGDGHDTVIDDFVDSWEIIWQADGTEVGAWRNEYSYNPETGQVRAPDGTIIRRNYGTAAAPDFRWDGRYDYDSLSQTLRRFVPPAPGQVSVRDADATATGDTLEFAPGILIQDIVLRQSGDDLTLFIGNADSDAAGTAGIRDSVTFKDWFRVPGSIERLAFYSTGFLDLATTGLVGGSDGDDVLAGGEGADWITGGTGDDRLSGGAGADILNGGGGLDLVEGGVGNDVLYGGGGDDVLVGGAGRDVLIGGAGADTASYAGSDGVVASLKQAQANTGDAAGDSYAGIENLTGGSGSDELTGDEGENVLSGGAGSDILRGDLGDDTYVWNADGATDGADVIVEGGYTYAEVVNQSGQLAAGYVASVELEGIDDYYLDGTDIDGVYRDNLSIYDLKYSRGYRYGFRLTISNGSEVVYNEYVTGGRRTFSGDVRSWPTSGWLPGYEPTGVGSQVVRAMVDGATDGGDDTLELGNGIGLADLAFAFDGRALAITYRGQAASSITIAGQGTTGGRIETLQFHDGLAANLAGLRLGSDGGSGEDLVIGGVDVDVLAGGDGNDVLFGAAGDDRLAGDAGDDTIEGGSGADAIDGGANSATDVVGWGDTARYASSAAAVEVDLASGGPQLGGDAAGDVLTGIENLVGSQAGGDTISGDEGGNRLFGLGGNDRLSGRGGDDVLDGGDGNDELDGGAGDDALSGGTGDDRLLGGAGRDVLAGGDGADQLDGGSDDDRLTGGSGNDTLEGAAGDDVLGGEDGNDLLTGGVGNDVLAGGGGDDQLLGGAGDDTYLFGRDIGTDVVTDGEGENRFVFDGGIERGALWLTRQGDDLRIGVVGGSTVVTYAGAFAGGAVPRGRIVTGTSTLFLDSADARSLIAAMTAHSAGTPGTMPATMSGLLGKAWDDGTAAAPRAPSTPQTIYADANAPLGLGTNQVDLSGWPSSTALPTGGASVAGWQVDEGRAAEAHWVAVAGPAGGTVAAIEAGQTDGDAEGGGAATNRSTIDATKAYALTYFFRLSAVGRHDLVFGVSGAAGSYVEGVGGSAVSGNVVGRIAAGDQAGLEADRWYKVVAYVLPEGAVTNGPAPIGGVYDAASGARVAVLGNAVRWSGTRPDSSVGLSFGVEGAAAEQAWSALFHQPELRRIDALTPVVIDAGAGVVDHDDATLIYALDPAGAPAQGKVELLDAATGQVRYTPGWGASGTDRFALIATDAKGQATRVPVDVVLRAAGVNAAPAVPAAGFALSHIENAAAGVQVGTIAATDADGPVTALDYAFTGAAVVQVGGRYGTMSADGRYWLDRDSGAVTLRAATSDFETNGVGFDYAVTVTDRDSGNGAASTSATLHVALRDVNEPHSLRAASVDIAEFGVALGPYIPVPDVNGYAISLSRLMLSDPEGATLRWRLAAGQGEGPWSVDADGTLYMLGATDYETRTAYTLTVEAVDDALGLTRSATLTINLQDVVDESNMGPVQFGTSAPRTRGYYFANLETVRLSDGSTRTAEQLATLFVGGQQTEGDDTVYGSTFADSIDASGGNDTIYAGIGQDVLRGGTGDDAYRFELGDGQDVIEETAGTDMIRFGHGIAPASVRVRQAADGNDLVLSYGTLGDTVTITGGLADVAKRVERVTFAEGSVWTFADLFAASIAASAGNDIFYGTDEGDYLPGGTGDDLLLGRGGSDLLDGGLGDDVFVWSPGDGDDTIATGSNTDGFNVLEVRGGVTAADLRYAYSDANGSGLVIRVAGQTGSVTLKGQLVTAGLAGIDAIRFADGTLLRRGEFQNQAFDQISSASGDRLFGSAGIGEGWSGNSGEIKPIDVLKGGDGDDVIDARAGDDTLIGGKGNDQLIGGEGSDVYRFTRGDGSDIVRDQPDRTLVANSGNDILELGAGIGAGDVVIRYANDGNDFVISLAGSTDRVTLVDTLDFASSRIEKIRLADGSVWDFAEQLRRATANNGGNDSFWGGFGDDSLFGGDGDDKLYGRGGNDSVRGGYGDDSLTGGGGDDSLSGDGGDDVYMFERGDGSDTIRDYSGAGGYGGFDTLRLGAGIDTAQVTISQASNGTDLIVSVAGTSDRITLAGTLTTADQRIEQLRFSDGTVWDAAELLRRSMLANGGNDVFHGSYDSETLLGGLGVDTLRARSGDDVLVGGKGDDTLSGDGGNDTYVFNRGDGADTVRDYSGAGGYGGIDIVQLGTGIATHEVTVSQASNGTDLIVSITGTSDRITLAGTLTTADQRIEQLRFSDGTIWDAAELLRRSMLANGGNDVFHGSYDGEILLGGVGADTLRARDGDDVLVGGKGDDTLSGDGGNDTYAFNRGDGSDTIRDYSGAGGYGGLDVVQLGAGISSGEVTVTQAANGTDLVVSITGTSDRITLAGTLTSADQRIEQLRFAEGTVWDAAELLRRSMLNNGGNDAFNGSYDGETLRGGAGNDVVRARAGDDVLVGGTGDDTLSGDGGNDTYVFNRGDGADTIRDYSGAGGYGGTDTLQFAADIVPADVIVSQAANGTDLILSIAGTADRVTLSAVLTTDEQRIEIVRFADGTTWDETELVRRSTMNNTSNDIFYGGLTLDSLMGGSGNDILRARQGDDVLVGGTGDDTLSGDAGNDTYLFSRGDGQDTIIEWSGAGGYGGSDVLQLGTGIASADVAITRSGNDLIVALVGTSDRVLLRNTILNGDHRIEWLRFADGTILSYNDMLVAANQTVAGYSGPASYRRDGTAGVDTLTGDGQENVINGYAGNDLIKGGGGRDWIRGGAGDDRLEGAEGADVYIYELGDGIDVIYDDDYDDRGADRIRFGQGIALADLLLSGSPSDMNELNIGFRGQVGSIKLQRQWDNSWGGVELFEFEDGTIIGQAELGKLYTAQQASVNADRVVGTQFGDNIDGGDGNDTLIGWGGRDIMIGGPGNDRLEGGNHGDTYVYDLGDGDDVIYDDDYDDREADRVRFGAGIGLADLIFSGNVGDMNELKISFAGQVGSITLQRQWDNSWGGVELFEFADGTVVDQAAVALLYIAQQSTTASDRIAGTQFSDVMSGGAGDDKLIGWKGSDTITGGAGDDRLEGGEGADVYVYRLGDGADTIYDDDYDDRGDDRIVFGPGIALSDLLFIGNPSDINELNIAFRNQAGSIRIERQWDTSWGGVELFEFADGTVVDEATIGRIMVGQAADAGVQRIVGTNSDDVMTANVGDTTLLGLRGRDVLTGGVGNDRLEGGDQGDTYIYNLGDGDDVINDNDYDDREGDRIKFGAGMTLADLVLTGNLNDLTELRIGFAGQTGSIRIERQWDNSLGGVEFLEFADGTTADQSKLARLYVVQQSSGAADRIAGTQFNDVIDGGAGNDTLIGWNGRDTLTGGIGDDRLEGGDQADIYVYNLGDGDDVIKDDDYDDRANDRVRFGAGITLADLVFSSNPNDINELRIGFVGKAGSIRVERQWDNSIGGIELIEFVDGTTLDQVAISKLYLAQQPTAAADRVTGTQFGDTIEGAGGNDTLVGWNGRDTLIGGIGDDRLEGGEQGDVYVYNLGDGADVIRDDDYDDREQDRIRFGAGITFADLIFYRPTTGSKDLRIAFRQGGGSILIERQDEFYGGVEVFEFADGTVIGAAQLAGVNTGPTGGNDSLEGTSGADALYGLEGNDRIRGQAGDDRLDGGDGDDQIHGDAPPIVAQTGGDLIVNGSFETSGTIVGSGGWGKANADMPGWTKANSQPYEQVYSGYAGINATQGAYWLDMDSAGGSGSNMDIGQTVAGLAEGQVMLLSFDHIGRSGGSSDFEVRWNGEVVGTYRDYGSTMKTDQLQLTAKAGDNVLRFVALGSADASGAALDNVRLFATTRVDEVQGNDILRGGKGSDQLTGGLGDDRYLYDRGDGQDVIVEAPDGGRDRLVLGTGITPSDIEIRVDGADLRVVFATQGDAILIKGGVQAGAIEEIVFADGTVWEWTGGGFSPRYTAGDDVVTGRGGADDLRGGEGNDVLTGLGGADQLRGDGGNDVLSGGADDDVLIGGGGNDRLSGDAGNDLLDGGAGDDALAGGEGDDVFRYAGADTGRDAVDGGAGADQLLAVEAGTRIGLRSLTAVEAVSGGGFADVTIQGTEGADDFSFEAVSLSGIAAIETGLGNDRVVGSTAADVIRGGAGDDVVSGGLGNDTLAGGEGADTLEGGEGADTLLGDAGDDRLDGGRGDDLIDGGSGDDVIATGPDNGFDAIEGGTGRDRVVVTGGVLGVRRIAGVEIVSGAVSNAPLRIEGSAGDDLLDFALTDLTAVDRIDGGAGNDVIVGSAGADVMAGGAGSDTLSGGSGDDTFQYHKGDGDDFVSDAAGNDLLVLSGIAAGDVSVAYSSTLDDIVLTIAGGGSITLKGVAGDAMGGIEKIGFLGGIVWSSRQVKAMADASLATISGDAQANDLVGTAGNDRLVGGGGDDRIDGGAGVDVAVYRGASDGFAIETVAGSIVVRDLRPDVAGDEGADELIGIEKVEFDDRRIGLAAPIVLDLDGNGVELVAAADSDVRFDWDGDGRNDRTGWVGAGDGLLVLDRDGDGLASGAGELSFTADKPGARSDLDGLSAFDSDGDGHLTSADTAWRRFLVWQDANRDGVSQATEMRSLEEAGIASLDLGGTPTARQWAPGANVVVNETSFGRTDGSRGSAVDVALSFVPTEPKSEAPKVMVEVGADDRLALIRQAMVSFGPASAATIAIRDHELLRYEFYA